MMPQSFWNTLYMERSENWNITLRDYSFFEQSLKVRLGKIIIIIKVKFYILTNFSIGRNAK
jgi:hypothetical protein